MAVNTLTHRLLFFYLFFCVIEMRIALFVVLSCVCICFVHCVTITNWGNVHTRSIGAERVVEKSSWLRVKTHTFSYPKVDFDSFSFEIYSIKNLSRSFFPFLQHNSSAPIIGITHMDFKQHPVSVKFVKGFIGDRNITIQIDSQRGHGINSTFIFFTY